MRTFGGILLVVIVLCVPAYAGEDEAYLKAKPEDMAWWRAARFGMFVHWGPVSLKGTEIGWSRGGERRGRNGRGQIPAEIYDNLYKQFNPKPGCAKQWVELAQTAGMKYIVFTTKHHDGFCMFDSKLTDYKITNAPYGKDFTKELADACHEAGLRLGFYYSPPDWHHPDYRTKNHARYIEYLHGQLRELCTNYGRVDIIWFDGLGGKESDWNSKPLFKMIRELQPRVIINNRAGLPADYDTPEQRVGKFQIGRPWETCMTICHQWAWKPNDRMKPLDQCLRTLLTCAGGDGNLLFNVGPMPTGEIEPRQVARLKEMGKWLDIAGPAVYGTRGGPFKPATWGVSTRKGNSIYLHVFDWGDGTLTLPPIKSKITGCSLWGHKDVKVADRVTPAGIEITVPADRRDRIATTIELSLDGPAMDIPPLSIRSDSLAAGGKASASAVFRKLTREYGPQMAFDDDDATRWATDAGTNSAWIAVDLGKAKAVARAFIMEAYEGRVQEFELQYKDGDAWKTIHKGTAIGAKREVKFTPVTARHFRLNILKAADGPTIWEFRLYPPKKQGK